MKLERILLMNFCLVVGLQLGLAQMVQLCDLTFPYYDIILAIDETKDIDNTQVISFFPTFFYSMNIAWDSTRIGVISFNDNSTTTLYSLSNETQTLSEITNVLTNLPSSDDVSSEPSLAINAAIGEFSNYGRKNIPQIMLLVAGAIGNQGDLNEASSNLKNANVTLMIYDMSGGFFNPNIASSNFTFHNYSQDSTQQAFCTIKYSYCGVTTGKFDIILGIDGSTAMSNYFDDVRSSLLTLFYPFTISQTTNRVAVFTYDDKTTNNFSTLTTVMDYQGLSTLISNLPEPNASDSSPNLAMAFAHNMFYLDARPDAKQVFLMVAATLGADSDNSDRVCSAENNLVNSNITTLLIDASLLTLPPCLSPMYHAYITANLTSQVIDDICTIHNDNDNPPSIAPILFVNGYVLAISVLINLFLFWL